MSEPTISRRCPTCRATIRNQAFFCPQCGNKLAPPPRPARTEPPKVRNTEDLIGDPSSTLTESDYHSRGIGNIGSGGSGTGKPGKAALGDAGSKFPQVSSKARDVEGDVLQRVQKLREISSVVIDEASYDPSLRFVLVAAALFIISLVIALLNRIIG